MSQAVVRVDASLYTSVPRVNVRSALALTRSLLTAVPRGAPPGVRQAAQKARADGEALRTAHRASRAQDDGGKTARTLRTVDNEADSLHATGNRRLADFTVLAGYDDAVVARAAALHARLYPDGVEFVRGDMLSQWQDTETWFEALAEGDNEPTLRALIGDVFVDAIRTVHAEYGRVLGVTKARKPEAPRVDLAAPLATLTEAIADLALQLVATANDRSATYALRNEARAALRPIDDLREGNARRTRRAASEPDATDATDAPDATDAADAADGTDTPLPEVK